jgi:hypothetical protein
MADPTPKPGHATTSIEPADRLWHLWEQGRGPRLEVFLAQIGPVTRPQLLAILRTDQQARWRSGERVLVESYLRLRPDLKDDAEGLLDLIYSEVVLRECSGERPQVAEYERRFPEHAAALRQQFAVHRVLQSDVLLTPYGAEATLTAPGSATPGDPGARTESLDTAVGGRPPGRAPGRPSPPPFRATRSCANSAGAAWAWCTRRGSSA